MKETYKYRLIRKIMFCTGLIMLSEIICPAVALALTGGPAQPEFSSFEPVATTSMVNEFTGDMTYNIPVLNLPGANGGGYAMSLSYHSGSSSEEEASWVGYGWTLNPGAINRGKKGFADDIKGKTVNYWNKMPANWTATLGGAISYEAFSLDLKKILGASFNASLRYNNYKGLGSSTGVNLNIAKGLVSLGYNISDGDGSFSAAINPMALLSLADKDKKKNEAKKEKYTKGDIKTAKEKWKTEKKGFNKKALTSGMGALNIVGSKYGLYSHSGGQRSFNVNKYKGFSANVNFTLNITPTPLEIGVTYSLSGSYSRQENVNSSDVAGAADPIDVYGYMYSAYAGSNNQMDYYTENDNPYDKRDYYLGIPFSNADNFMMTGEGMAGGFRLYNKYAGHFKPRLVTSKIQSYNLGVSIETGMDMGGGADLGVGFQRFGSIGWSSPSSFARYDELDEWATVAALQDEPYFFRFNNDKGGYYDFNSDELQSASPQYQEGIAGNKSYEADISAITTTANQGNRSSRSSYMAYHTNAEMVQQAFSKSYRSYSVNPDVNQLIDRSNPSITDEVGEYAAINEDGLRYVYGLPVYSRNELNMQYDVIGATNVQSKYLVYKNISDGNLKVKTGEESPTPYASSYLLTEITSPDYIDRTMDGPSDDDFGGYTRFSYNRVYGHNAKDNPTPWYRWRTPYTGLLYSRGELSSQRDDMGGVTAGEKEIYYLDTIVTKTHFAVFETSDRNDGYDAADNSLAAADTVKGNKKLKQLNAIRVYAKIPGGSQLLQTVRFEYYDNVNSAFRGIPNCASPGNNGKLTLKRVWFEYEGAVNAKISPYEFEYNYPTTTYPTKYTDIDNRGSGLAETPRYTYHCLDAWGNYQEDGNSRYENMKTWVNQNPAAAFDPAAWQLKVIRLPSGGEIHIQYEQDDYLYVQNRHAEALVSVSSISNEVDVAQRKYYLDIATTFGTASIGADKLYIKDLIQKDYVDGDKKMYFKFLYKLLLGSPGPNLNSCASEYITGYCNVREVGSDGTGLYIKLGRKKGGNKRFDLPVKVCRDYVKKERLGTLNTSGNCSEPGKSIKDDPNNPKHVVESLLTYLVTKIVPTDHELCTEVNEALSYFKIPVPPRGKKGGGIRVKRLLMYDAGIETGDEALFGSEYQYIQTNGYSSGVAVNEPGAIREENALVEFDPRLKQKFLDKVIAGRDRDETEKPLGESMLPSPSVGYSRVVISNIYTGKTNTGFAVKEFHTAFDHPVSIEYTGISKAKDYLPIPGGLINYFVNNVWLTQGFVCKLNEMHGQPRREATYNGNPQDINQAALSTESVYEYYQPGAPVPVSSAPGQISYSNFGKETEQVMESRGMEDVSNDMAISFDLSVGFMVLPLPQFSIVPSYTYSESKAFSHVTNKIIQYPVIQKSVRTYADGIYHTTENLTFDPNTGKPNTTRSYDGYNALNLQQSAAHNGSYTSYQISAASQYPGMGQRSTNERFLYKSNPSTIKMQKYTDGTYYALVFTPAAGYNACDLSSRFIIGDFVKLTRKSDVNTSAGLFHIVGLFDNRTDLIMERTANFRTANDDLFSSEEVIVEILKSGYTNQLNSDAGGFTTYGESIESTNLMSRNALAALLDYSAHHSGQKIYADDPFFQTYKDLKASVNNGSCISFVNANGSFDPSGVSSIFKNATGYIQLLVNTIGGLGYTLKINNGSSDILNCVSAPQAGCGPEYKVVIDAETGQLMIKQLVSFCGSSGCDQPVNPSCFKLCPAANTNINNVIAANAQVYYRHWPYDTTLYKPVAQANSIESGLTGKWRPYASYLYRDTLLAANTGTERNYKNAGVFKLEAFDYYNTGDYELPGSKWVKTSTVTKYSPDGNALEERDIFGITSTAKFGYSRTQPYLVAKNANYASVQFESFENAYTIYGTPELEDGWRPPSINTKRLRSNTLTHTGKYSWVMNATDSLQLKPMLVTQQMFEKGIALKVWVNDTALSEGVALKGRLKITGTVVNYNFNKIANVGNWALYEMRTNSLPLSFLGTTITPVIVNNYTGKTIWIDDLRFQPLDSSVMTYVYDIYTTRLIATFDDQHFGMFYRYNGEGKLMRKEIETERGLKMITETQYHSAQQKAR